jgi:hypothetical protein
MRSFLDRLLDTDRPVLRQISKSDVLIGLKNDRYK